MVIGRKMTITSVPSKRHMSIIKIQNFTDQKRQSIVRLVYGVLLMVLVVTSVAIDPLSKFTNWYLDIREGSFVANMWAKPTYELFSEIWVFNYTNVPEYLNGDDHQLQLNEIGPFWFQEIRTNENLTIDRAAGVMRMNPTIVLKFLPEQSVAHYDDVQLYVPNIALVAISTLLADNLGYLANVGAYYSINALGSKLFRSLNGTELLWGHYDPVVTVANTLLPGWIDFGKLGILDRFYAPRHETVEVEIHDNSKKYSIVKWNDSPGLPERGFVDLNTSTLCNRVQGSYEGLMLHANLQKGVDIPIFRRQACRVYPFEYEKELMGPYGFNIFRYKMSDDAMNMTSPYACPCEGKTCLPDGFVDISSCYYGFPIALSKPHFLHAAPEQLAWFRGLRPEPRKHSSFIDLEPNQGAPIALASRVQMNVAARASPGNPLTRPLHGKVLPLMWVGLHCREPPPSVVTLLRLRFVIAPPLIITAEIFLFIIGFFLGVQGFRKLLGPKYQTVPQFDDDKPSMKELKNMESIIIDADTSNLNEFTKQTTSLLPVTEMYEDDDFGEKC